jgi:hypothetical protein
MVARCVKAETLMSSSSETAAAKIVLPPLTAMGVVALEVGRKIRAKALKSLV